MVRDFADNVVTSSPSTTVYVPLQCVPQEDAQLPADIVVAVAVLSTSPVSNVTVKFPLVGSQLHRIQL